MKTNRNIKRFLLYLAFICSGSQLYTQSNPFNFHIDWKIYEADIDYKDKIDEIRKIKDDLLEYLEDQELLQENISKFHFVDHDLNGVIDIVYSGDAGTESKRTLIFELEEEGYYSKTFDQFGELVNIFQGNGLASLSLLLREDPCCGGNTIVYEVYHPVNKDNRLQLQPSSKYCSILGTILPKTVNKNPILFEVENDLYYLRLTPSIDNDTHNESLNITGNILAEYTSGARGYAISESQDESGRIWWFVMMTNYKKPVKSMLDWGSNNDNDFYSIGWMSSRYLKELSK